MIDHAKHAELAAEKQSRLGKLKTLYVKTNEIDGALEVIHELRTTGYRGLDEDAYCCAVIGPSNVGKSRLFATYCARPDAQRKGDIWPVVRIKVPSAIQNVKEFHAALLRGLGTEPFINSHNKDWMADRIVEKIDKRGVELIMIEEVQHLLDKKSGNLGYWGADVIKELLLDRARVPVAINGIEVADQMFIRNSQLMSRRKSIFRLHAYDWDIALERERFETAIWAFERAARFPKKLGLVELGLAERIHRATGGLIGNLCKLFEVAIGTGIQQEKDSIDQALLAVAHASISDGGRGWKNAFLVDVLPPVGAPDESRVTKLNKKRKPDVE